MKLEWLYGKWRTSAGQIEVVFTFIKTAKGIRIQAIDESDGEKLRVSKVKWDGKVLNFETYTPSKKWRTRNRFKPLSRTNAVQELTYWEPWTKLDETGEVNRRAKRK